MRTAAEHLNRALKDLQSQRDEIDRQISIIERTLDDLGAAAGVEVISGRQTVREIALSMAHEGMAITPTEVVEESTRRGNPAKYESVSSILSRMHREGALEKGSKRGTYYLAGRLPGPPNPDDESPQPSPVKDDAPDRPWDSEI